MTTATVVAPTYCIDCGQEVPEYRRVVVFVATGATTLLPVEGKFRCPDCTCRPSPVRTRAEAWLAMGGPLNRAAVESAIVFSASWDDPLGENPFRRVLLEVDAERRAGHGRA